MDAAADRAVDVAPMDVVLGIDALGSEHGRLFVVVGVFDGLHRGHAYLLEHLVRAARARDARPAVITFDHHPDEVIRGSAPPLLLDPDERLELLAATGVSVTVVQTFDAALRDTPFEAFVRRIVDRVDLAGFLMTPESAFGHRRKGTPEAVAALGRDLAYEVVVVPQFTLDGEPVSSSAVRAAIASGALDEAARQLGRAYAVVGTAVADGAGTALAFASPVALPPPGTYPVVLAAAGGDERRLERVARVQPDGRLTIPGLSVSGVTPGSRVRVTFESSIPGF